ncbi:hypothetical protein KW807_00740 [Candidatus Parcubacteria bacterium]|nr:hypothetical protein [Candidatus Parcubacteria bacterium]
MRFFIDLLKTIDVFFLARRRKALDRSMAKTERMIQQSRKLTPTEYAVARQKLFGQSIETATIDAELDELCA